MKGRAKEAIIGRIEGAALAELPHPGTFLASTSAAARSIDEAILASGATPISCDSIEHFHRHVLPDLVSSAGYYSMLESETSPSLGVDALLEIKTTVAVAEFIVREHGALWIPALPMRQSAPLFTCEHLILLAPRSESVATMVEAMPRIANRAGWFICGPSKTADIEQCLVVGAQGARRVTTVLYG